MSRIIQQIGDESFFVIKNMCIFRVNKNNIFTIETKYGIKQITEPMGNFCKYASNHRRFFLDNFYFVKRQKYDIGLRWDYIILLFPAKTYRLINEWFRKIREFQIVQNDSEQII